jgi:hypothetical protein
MPQDTARSVQLRRQIASEMRDALGIGEQAPVELVQDALENSLDMHHAEIVEIAAEGCSEAGHHHRRNDS